MALLEEADDPGEEYTNKQKKTPAVWGFTKTEIFSKRQKVCLLQYNSTIDHKGHLLGEPCTTGVHHGAGQQCETPRESRKNYHTMDQCCHPSQCEIKLKAHMQ